MAVANPRHCGCPRVLRCVLGVCAVAAAYDFDDPHAAHTSQAIQWDRENRRGDSRRAFESAARFTPTTQTMVNLGVCYMRLASGSGHRAHKVELYVRRRQAPKSAFEQLMGFGSRMAGLGGDAPAMPARDFLLHQRPVAVADDLPRVDAADLAKFAEYEERRDPFVLRGATAGWKAVEEAGKTNAGAWAWLEALADQFPDAVTDFYPYNMLSSNRQSPYLTRFRRAVKELKIVNDKHQQLNGSAFRYESGNGALRGRYMHLQLTPDVWSELEKRGAIAADRHWQLENDAWLEECLGYPHGAVAAEYHLKTHWKILLVGARGAGMFNHSDSLQTSSWHAQLAGRKWWHVCGALSDGRPKCYEGIIAPGEILYYGRGWSHETQNLDDPTATITDTAVHARNFAAVADKLHGECTREVLDFRFSGQLCDALDACYNVLHRAFKDGRDKPPSMWRPWRGLAAPELVEKRKTIVPEHNNYDGRNYITE
ncbi:hypothetical protein JL721_9857 [Aureococcus anophagefferens]|nr:hypothetical protein JL721_9857 [Aureococcus anophagefferens]